MAAVPRQWLALALVATGALCADQLTKAIVTRQLGIGEGVHVIGPLSITHVQNPGIAFGLLAGAAPVVSILTATAVVWMLLYFARSGARHPMLPLALGLLIGGSAANLVDRVRLGQVTDFVDIPHWRVFNLADSFIVAGVALLFLTLAAIDRGPRLRHADALPRP